MGKNISTSWGKEAEWYNDLVMDENSYQQQVLLPNLLRLMKITKGEKILDIGCGSGFFSKAFAEAGAVVTGVDIGSELIRKAQVNFPEVSFVVASAEDLGQFKDGSFETAVMVLSLQNISDGGKALAEASRVLNKNGNLYLVLNHPAFRIPGSSSWGWDEKNKLQYRIVEEYLSEKKVKIQMHPGEDPKSITWSFHRPLQYYFKHLAKSGFAVEKLEEWITHRKTKGGPREEAENRAKKEIPLFLALIAVKIR